MVPWPTVEGWIVANLWPAVTTVTGFSLVAIVVTAAAFNRPLESESSLLEAASN